MITPEYNEEGQLTGKLIFNADDLGGSFRDVQRVIDKNAPFNGIVTKTRSYLKSFVIEKYNELEEEYVNIVNVLADIDPESDDYDTTRRDELESQYPYLKDYRLDPENADRSSIPDEPEDQSNFIDQLKNKFKNYTEQLRKNYLKKGYTVSLGYKMDCTDLDINNWSNALTGLNLSGGTEISVADYNNVTRVLTKSQFETMCNEVGQNWQYAFQIKWNKRNAIDGVSKGSELLEIDYSF